MSAVSPVPSVSAAPASRASVESPGLEPGGAPANGEPERRSDRRGAFPGRVYRWVRSRIRVSWAGILLLLLALAESAVLVVLQAANFQAFFFSQGDIGNYNQAIWTATHGQGFFFYTTNIPAGTGGSVFAVHFAPILALVAPLYAVAAGPLTLVALKQLALALTALPLYGLARVYFPGRAIPLAFGILYLLSPLNLTVDWNSFDPEAFIPLLLVCALFCFATGRFWGFLAFWILTLSTIETIPALLVLFAAGGLVGTLALDPISPWLSRKQERRYLFAALLTALIWLGLAYLVLRSLSPNAGAFGDVYGARYTVLGAKSFIDVPIRAVTDPAAAGAALQYDGSLKALFVVLLIAASGVISLLAGLRYLLPVAAYLALALLSNNPPLFTVGTQYVAYLAGFLFVAAIEGAVLVYSLLAHETRSSRRTSLGESLARSAAALVDSVRKLRPGSTIRDSATAEASAALTSLKAGSYRAATRHIRAGRWLVSQASELPPDPRFDSSLRLRDTRVANRPPEDVSRVKARRRAVGLTAAVSALPTIAILLAFAVANPFVAQPLAADMSLTFGSASTQPGSQQVGQVLGYLPPSAAVLTTSHIFTSVSNRRNAFTPEVDGFFAGTTNYSYWVQKLLDQSQYLLLSSSIDRAEAAIMRAETNLTGFGVYAEDAGAFLARRGWTGPPVEFVPWSSVWAGGALKPLSGTLVTNTYATAAGQTLFHPAGGTIGSQMWGGPSDLYVPPGVYDVNFTVKVENPTGGAPSLAALFRVSETPAVVKQTAFDTSPIGSHYSVSIGPSGGPPVVLASRTLSSNATKFVSSTVSLKLNWTDVGYLSFLGFQESTTMSMYLLAVTVTQLSPLV